AQSGAMTNRPYYRWVDFSPEGKLLPELNRHGRISPPLEGTIPYLLCYGYGPFRRLEGAPSSVASAFQFRQPLSPFVTLFTDEIGLADATRALIDQYIASIDPQHTGHRTAREALTAMTEVVNSLLPGGVQLESVTSERVRFKTADGLAQTEKDLSDG